VQVVYAVKKYIHLCFVIELLAIRLFYAIGCLISHCDQYLVFG